MYTYNHCYLILFLGTHKELYIYHFLKRTNCPNATTLRENEMLLKDARKKASSGIGMLISIGHKLVAPEWQSHLNILPFVTNELPHVHFRVQKSYALLLLVSKLVSYNY